MTEVFKMALSSSICITLVNINRSVKVMSFNNQISIIAIFVSINFFYISCGFNSSMYILEVYICLILHLEVLYIALIVFMII